MSVDLIVERNQVILELYIMKDISIKDKKNATDGSSIV